MICGSTLKGAQKHQGAQISLQTRIQVFASAIPPPGSWAPPPTLWNSDSLKRVLLCTDFCHHSFLPHYHLHHREQRIHDTPQEMQKISVKLHSDCLLCSSSECWEKRVLATLAKGGRTEMSSNHPQKCPKASWRCSSSWIHAWAPSALVALSVPIAHLHQWFC